MTKQKITEIVLELLHQENKNIDLTLDDVEKTWWVSKRFGRSYEISESGFLAFKTANLESYRCFLYRKDQLDIPLKKLFIELGKKLVCPYYIDQKNRLKHEEPLIFLFDEKIAMTIELYGSALDYIHSFSNQYAPK
jgi:hypothetical protein